MNTKWAAEFDELDEQIETIDGVVPNRGVWRSADFANLIFGIVEYVLADGRAIGIRLVEPGPRPIPEDSSGVGVLRDVLLTLLSSCRGDADHDEFVDPSVTIAIAFESLDNAIAQALSLIAAQIIARRELSLITVDEVSDQLVADAFWTHLRAPPDDTAPPGHLVAISPNRPNGPPLYRVAIFNDDVMAAAA